METLVTKLLFLRRFLLRTKDFAVETNLSCSTFHLIRRRCESLPLWAPRLWRNLRKNVFHLTIGLCWSRVTPITLATDAWAILIIIQCRSKGRGRGRSRAPPSFFSKKVKTDLYKMLKIRYYQAIVCKVSKKDLPMKSTFASKATYYDDSEKANIYWFQDTEIVSFLFCNWRCKCFTLKEHWFAETVYEVNNSRYA